MADNESLEYNLPQNAYASFDAVTLKDFIIKKLENSSNFSDQNYEGSNLSSLIDIIAYSYHVLIFYLNQTSSEALFSEASIYENINRIVKLIGYKPTGKQTSLVPVNCVAEASMAVDSYYIRKYSYILVDGIQYSVLDNFFFNKTTTSQESIDAINNNLILYQGTIQEYPTYEAFGDDYETLTLVVDNLVNTSDKRFIADGTISVYVKEKDSDTWFEYTETENLYLNSASERVYDLRLNENGHYEIKFGNDTFGRKLVAEDQIVVYYILSDSDKGIISKNAINGNKLFNFNNLNFSEILTDTVTTESTLVDSTNNFYLTFSNPINSTTPKEAETVEEIKQNAPLLFSSQYRLVTENDYETYLSKILPNILNSIKVVNNKDYMEEYINYFYEICIDPNKSNRVLLNQVNFADPCDFNNINIFCCPKFSITEDEDYPVFLSESFKNLIIETTAGNKMINYEVVPRDPIYMAFDIGHTNSSSLDLSVVDNSKLVVYRDSSVRVSEQSLKSKIIDVITAFFDPSNNELGQKLEMNTLMANILDIKGITSIKTLNVDENSYFEGVSFLSWNPIYENSDLSIVNKTTSLPYFKFPYFYRPNALLNKIEVVNE